MNEEYLLAKISVDVGGADRDEARHAVEITLTALAAALDPVEAEALAGELPPRLAAAVRAGEQGAPPWSDDLLGDLAAREGVGRGRAAEYAMVVCASLAEQVGEDVATLLARRLPAPWRDWFQRRPVADGPTPPYHPAARDTLASGRPGSRHAVADHGASRVQAESIAREENPHAGAKLSSGAPAGDPLRRGAR